MLKFDLDLLSLIHGREKKKVENRQIVFTKKNTAELLPAKAVEPGEDQVMVRTMFSTISAGTERANLTGDANINIYTGSEVSFPRYSGYSSSGIVVKKGRKIQDVEVGDQVAVGGGFHKAYNTLASGDVVRLEEDNVSLQEAALVHIGTFSMAAIRKTRLEIGESALVMGCGILGLFAVQFAHAAGAVPVIAADPVRERRNLALSLGADFVFDPLEEDFAEKVKAVTGGGVHTAVEVTGQGKGLDETLDCMAKFGRVALLGCTRNSDFTIDYYRKVHGPGITLIGAHTNARPAVESHPGWFTKRDDMKAILKLCGSGRIDLKKMIFGTYSPEECTEVYRRLAEDRDFPPVIQFDWSKCEV